ncbi:protein translocase subunit SecF [Patescibacteria group bacterium]|nr:protein translocase subunit SecF [Patescibacteria group bacterium]
MNILGTRKIWFVVSSILLIVGIVSISVFGYKTGIDFAGGTILEIQAEESKIPNTDSRQLIIDAYKDKIGLDVAVQTTEAGRYFVRSNQISNDQKNEVIEYLKQKFNLVEELRFESVDPTIGTDVVRKAILALIVAVIGILLYLAYAFRRVPKELGSFRFGTAAIMATLHDVLILLGLYAIVGRFWGAEIDGMFITALLTVVGFSTHDTIVTFDRIRENLRRRPGDDLEVVVNDSIIETIIRSISTSVTLLFVLIAMFFFGGATLKFFTLALIIGVFFGVYSSIFIASPLLLWGIKKR